MAVASCVLAAEPDTAKEQRAARVIHELQEAARVSTNSLERERLKELVVEVRAAAHNNSRPPVPARIDVIQLPWVHYRYAHARVGLGDSPAKNLPVPPPKDPSRVDPRVSTFWVRPTNIAAQNLAAGFGRAITPVFEDRVWEYAEPKTSYGGHAGFEAESDGERIKIKFGEIHSEPFTARVFHALGYNAEPTDFSPGLKIRYDRRLFGEFNSRRPVNTRITAMGVLPVWTIRFQPKHDPYRFIVAAVMKDGRRITPSQLRRAAIEEESQVDYLITAPANVQVKDPRVKNIGPWDFGQLGHEHLRELRGAGLLAAWLGWFDSRFENTRLKVVEHGGQMEVKHYFSDLGGGLGRRSGWLGWYSEDADTFQECFTRPEIRQGKGRMMIPFRIVNFRPIEPTPAFQEMTIDDARWMARLIAQLTGEQISDALSASGLKDQEVTIFSRKLAARRDRMLEDLGLIGADNGNR